jgi:hypothetical protein
MTELAEVGLLLRRIQIPSSTESRFCSSPSANGRAELSLHDRGAAGQV